MALIPVVNEQDKLIGYKERTEINPEDIYRASGLMIHDCRGKVLLAQRSFSKILDPGKWGPSAAGTVEKGETYESNILKETYEELGLQNVTPTPWIKTNSFTGEHKHIGQWFLLKLDSKTTVFKPDPREVQEIKWFTFTELEQEIKQNPDMFLRGIRNLVLNEPELCMVLFENNSSALNS